MEPDNRHHRRRSRIRGISAMELLATVGALGILLTISIVAISPLLDDVRKVKLENTVTTLNQAIDSFVAEGGSMTTVTSVDSAISALKTTAADKEIIAGYKGSYIDPRLEAIMQNATEAASPDWRALWDDAAKRFRLGQTGTGGVREFLFNDALVDTNFGEEDRKIMNPLAKEDSWIWDFDEPAAPSYLVSDAGDSRDTSDPGAPIDPDALKQLLPPGFSPPGKLFDYFDFPSTVELSNPNDPSVSEIQYSLNGAPWEVYTTPIPLSRDDQVSAFVKLTVSSPDVYSSFTTTELYRSKEAIMSGNSTGVFKQVVGASGLVSSIGSGQTNSELNFGQAILMGGNQQNQLKFAGSTFNNIKPEETFNVGQLTYLNSTTGVGTNAYSVTLQIDLGFSTPAGATETIDVALALESTKNYPWLTEDQKADYVQFDQIYTDFTAFFGGQTYYLNLEFAYSGADGYSSVDSFHVHEGKSATAEVIGYFSPTPKEKPTTTGGTGGTGTPTPPSLP